MKKIIRYLVGALLAVFVSSLSPVGTQLKANVTIVDSREAPGDPEAHTYHVHGDYYYITCGPYIMDEYSWTGDYDITVYTNPGETVELIDHLEESSGQDGPQYYYGSAYLTYS